MYALKDGDSFDSVGFSHGVHFNMGGDRVDRDDGPGVAAQERVKVPVSRVGDRPIRPLALPFHIETQFLLGNINGGFSRCFPALLFNDRGKRWSKNATRPHETLLKNVDRGFGTRSRSQHSSVTLQIACGHDESKVEMGHSRQSELPLGNWNAHRGWALPGCAEFR